MRGLPVPDTSPFARVRAAHHRQRPIKSYYMSSKKPTPAPEQAKTRPFTTTITEENHRRLANYQASKPGGAHTTDVVNQALQRFFDANRQYADSEQGNR